ncbi:hypothetical protein EW145_g7773 [Phellinidium pouzarii]|uniref:Microbial-type PARG catalytic domain-containing protein n=1 Tax=Phellinidium pouzarii TaxID=167371 RepID=A0A4V3XA28_9AGAM|nr:hypothetical protein EW145_g7773 [Phellinidium pouzarii]
MRLIDRILFDHNRPLIEQHGYIKHHPSLPMKAKSAKITKSRRGHRRGRGSSGGALKNRQRSGPEALREHRERLAQIAQDTFRTVLTSRGYSEDVLTDSDDDADARSESPTSQGTFHDLTERIMNTRSATSFYPHYSPLLAGWEKGPSLSVRDATATGSESSVPICSSSSQVFTTQFEFTTSSTLEAARKAWQSYPPIQSNEYGLGILNPASPKRPGGASLNGGVTLEECLVRQSTLYDSLQNSSAGAQFYAEHRSKSDGSGLHDHAMLYSPDVVVIKDDRGHRIAPYTTNIISSVPVHAGTVRAKFSIDNSEFNEGVHSVMHERMARVLRLFEERGDRILILGAFGVGQFCNSPDMIGEIWADLLCGRGAKFQNVFDRIVFAVPGKHRLVFEKAFNSKVLEAELEVWTEDS